MCKNKPKQLFASTLIASFVLICVPGRAQVAGTNKPAAKPAAPAVLPGKGLAQHDFFYAGEGRTRDMYIVRGGKVVWAYNDTTGRGEISDATLLSNGNVLFAHQYGVTLISPDKNILWNYDAPTNCEIHTAQPIGTNHVIFIQNGREPKLFVANIASGRMEKETPMTVGNTNSTHGQFRHARLTDAGTYLVAHMDMNEIVEYDETGKAVWAVTNATQAWSVQRLKNGNTLISGGANVNEINSKGETVWKLTAADIPGYDFKSIQIAMRLPNGNTLVNNWVRWDGATDPSTAPAQAIEITPDKKVVWGLRSWTNPNLGPSTTIQLLDEPDVPENAHFGSIK